jgi:hypothetical protein
MRILTQSILLNKLKHTLIILMLLAVYDLFAFTQEFEVGPQIYHLKRSRDGGTNQNGTLYGARISYERLKDYGFYFGAFLDAAYGPITGRSGSGYSLSSNFTDFEAQGLFGYTISCKSRFKAQLTPFIGVGFLEQTNKFKDPSPNVPIQFQDDIQYYSCGFLTTSYLNRCWSLGLRIQVKWMYEGKCYVTDDPDPTIGDVTQIIENKMLFAVDLPISYKLFGQCSRYKITLMPFFQTRHLGGRFNYPVDFTDTHYVTYGARLLFDIMF